MDAPRKSRGVARVKRAAVRFFLLWIPVGFAINVAVAWGLAAWMPHQGWKSESVLSYDKLQPRTLYLTKYSTIGACRQTWGAILAGDLRLFPFFGAIKDTRESAEYPLANHLEGQRWGNIDAVRRDPEKFDWDGCEHANGWPMLTGWCDWTITEQNRAWQLVLHGGISVADAPKATILIDASELRALPLRPIWLGLIVNTALYAALSAALWAGLIAFRFWRRAVRGRCTRCNYDLRGLGPGTPCPECGCDARRLAR